jgi:hypothetical protein
MSTITTILEPNEDGTVHLPVPAAWGCLRGKISMSPDFDEPLEDFKDYAE